MGVPTFQTRELSTTWHTRVCFNYSGFYHIMVKDTNKGDYEERAWLPILAKIISAGCSSGNANIPLLSKSWKALTHFLIDALNWKPGTVLHS